MVDEVKNQPINKATVFINGTTIGTTTNDRGEFALKIPFGRHILVALASGFETYGQFMSPDKPLDSFVIHLKTKTSLQDADGYEKDEWEKWGGYFITNFLGSTYNEQCKIKNTKVIRFQVSMETGDLSAVADEPLIIENKVTGYTILYKLESFHSNFKTLVINYTGYCFFQQMNGNISQQRNWEKRRSLFYSGSLMHFMRSVYRNQIQEEGFEVRPLKKIRSIISKNTQTDSSDLHFIKITDSTTSRDDDLQDQIMNPDNYKDVIGTSLPGDSIAYAIDSTIAGLDFKNFLLIVYRRTSSENEQYDAVGMTSQLALINKKPLQIEADGSFYDYRDLMILGYWTWSEKIYRLLPFDYSPPKSQ